MTINDFENLFMFAGGLGMFLFGVHSMSGGVQKCAGEQMRKLLGILTNNRFVGVLVGALITAVIQSSGATTVMIIGFINAGLMNLSQAVGPIMGANIGTCITAWIVSLGQLGDTFKTLSPSLYAPLIVAIGSFLIMFSKKERKQTIGEICNKFFTAREGVSTENRQRIMRFIENLCLGAAAVGYRTESMHGAGSPQAQRIMIARQGNIQGKKQLAKDIAGIQ